MKVWMNRNTCSSNLAACEGCFAQFAISGVPDRACVVKYVDDGSDTLTVLLRYEGHAEKLVIPPDKRELVAYEGWSKFVSEPPEFRKNEGDEKIR